MAARQSEGPRRGRHKLALSSGRSRMAIRSDESGNWRHDGATSRSLAPRRSARTPSGQFVVREAETSDVNNWPREWALAQPSQLVL